MASVWLERQCVNLAGKPQSWGLGIFTGVRYLARVFSDVVYYVAYRGEFVGISIRDRDAVLLL